jgi:hypothetical protein
MQARLEIFIQMSNRYRVRVVKETDLNRSPRRFFGICWVRPRRFEPCRYRQSFLSFYPFPSLILAPSIELTH